MNPEKQQIYQDPKLQRYFRKRNHKPKTRLLITDRFYYYYLATGLTPKSMIDEADMEEEQGIRLRRRKIIEHLDTFEDYLQDNYSENTIRTSISTIRTFYHHHHIEIPATNRKPRNNDVTLTVDDLPGLGDIRRAVNEARNTRDEAIIILMASSGMGKAEIMHLNWEHLITAIHKYEKVTVDDLFSIAQTRPEWAETIGPLTWTVQRIKTGHTYTTFSSPESFEKLLYYFQSRGQKQYIILRIIYNTMTITSKVNINNPRGSSLITSIPKTVREMLNLANKDTLEWDVVFEDGEWVASFKRKKD